MDRASTGPFELRSQRLGALPLVDHFLAHTGLTEMLARYLPADDARQRLAPAVAVRLVIINLLVGRRPLYGLGEWAARFAPGVLGLADGEVALLRRRPGRSGAGAAVRRRPGQPAHRAAAQGDRQVRHRHRRVAQRLTSISVSGVYRSADGRARGGKPTPAVTFGHSKDHRPDLKQLVFILTVAGDGAVPIAYRLADGNTNDDPTHVPTWDGLVALLGRADFLYVADSKLRGPRRSDAPGLPDEIVFSVIQRKVIKPGDFADLHALAQRLTDFEPRYNATTTPFDWRFTRADLTDMLARIDAHRPGNAPPLAA